MEGHRPAKAKAASGTFNLIPAGLAQSKRRYLAARFPQGAPVFTQDDYVLGYEQQAAAKQQKDPSLLLSRKQQQDGAGPQQLQGVPRPDAAGNYFVLSKAGGKWDFVVQPLETSYTFKPLVKGPAVSIEDVEAGMRPAAAAAGDPVRLLPKSVRRQLQDAAAAEAAEKRLQEEVVPMFDQAKVAELSAKYGGRSGQGQLVLSHEDEEGSDEGWGLTGGEDEEGGAAAGHKRGPGKDKDKKGAKGGKGRKGAKDAAGTMDISEDELPEDIYAGEEDELRPAAPTEDVDWEFQDQAADDDMDQGASDEEGLDDDPGYRKDLGLEGDDDDDDDDDDDEAKKEGQEDGAAADKAGGDEAGGAEAEGAAAGPSQASAGGSVESDDVDVEDAEDLDALVEKLEGGQPEPGSEKPAKKQRKGSVGPGSRDRSPAPSAAAAAAARQPTPPLGGRRATPPAAGKQRASTPPLGTKAAGGGSRQGSVGAGGGSRKTPPPGAGALRRTPPPAGGSAAAAAAAAAAGAAKRKREEAGAAAGGPAAGGSAGAAAAGGPRGYRWRPDQLDAQGVPSVEGMAQALSELGPITTTELYLLQEHLDVARIGDEGKKLLKSRMLQVAKVELINGVKYVVLKNTAGG